MKKQRHKWYPRIKVVNGLGQLNTNSQTCILCGAERLISSGFYGGRQYSYCKDGVESYRAPKCDERGMNE